jgi:hypothetical protein
VGPATVSAFGDDGDGPEVDMLCLLGGVGANTKKVALAKPRYLQLGEVAGGLQ